MRRGANRRSFVITDNERDLAAGLWSPPRRVLGIQASPRGAKGATERLYRALVKGLERAGAAVETVHLGELKAEACRGCFRCWQDEGDDCRIHDDLTGLLTRMPTYDLMVWASPVYVDAPPAQLKCLIDRMMVLNHPAIVDQEGAWLHPCRHPRLPNLVLLAVCGFWGVENFTFIESYARAAARHQHTPLLASLLRPESLSMMNPASRPALARVMEALERAGVELVNQGKVGPETAQAISQPLLSRDEYLELAARWWQNKGGKA